MLDCLSFLRELTLPAIALRLFIAMLLGGIMGLERGLKKRPAGFRTYMLVTVGSALVMITGQYFSVVYGSGDPQRLGAQVISGIGFLGAGTIIVTGRNQVRGLTTAAGLWASACIGLAVGIGYVEAAIIGFVLVYLALSIFHRFDKYLVARSKILEIIVEFESSDKVSNFADFLRETGIKISSMEFVRGVDEARSSVIITTLVMPSRGTHAEMIAKLSQLDGVKMLEEIL